ncbi:hypothetical protein HYT55_00960 [Candidatus Woesearchaeota archaeon]|nr:hypothetical protein [Candidatus Woesearchaeota archaeon]
MILASEVKTERSGLERLLNLDTERAWEIKVVFDDEEYLREICTDAVGVLSTGYSLTEQETCYLWRGQVERKKNYCASLLVPESELTSTATYLYARIREKWEVPFIQITPCLVNSEFRQYLELENDRQSPERPALEPPYSKPINS